FSLRPKPPMLVTWVKRQEGIGSMLIDSSGFQRALPTSQEMRHHWAKIVNPLRPFSGAMHYDKFHSDSSCRRRSMGNGHCARYDFGCNVEQIVPEPPSARQRVRS